MNFISEQQNRLLVVARNVISGHLTSANIKFDQDNDFQEPGATFVTLKKSGLLRGCIGSLEAREPLIEDVKHNAISAAFHDSRFSAVTLDELSDIRIEISILDHPRKLEFDSEADLLSQLTPGVDGIILEAGTGRYRATFLPQVWKQLPQPNLFMQQLKMKAGLDMDYWADDVVILRYGVVKFQEPD